MKVVTVVIAGVFACLTACGAGTTTSGTQSDGGTGGGGGGGNTGALAGTWDVTITRPDFSTVAGTITIAPGSVDVAFEPFEIAFSSTAPSAAVRYGTVHNTVAVTHSGSGLSLGGVPVDVGGEWTFGSMTSSDKVTASVAGSQMSATAMNWNGIVGASDRTPSGKLTAVRASTQTSILGDLGGEWVVNDDRGGSCDFTIQGNSLSAKCTNPTNSRSAFAGTLAGTFDSAGTTFSGNTTSGVEFAAHKR